MAGEETGEPGELEKALAAEVAPSRRAIAAVIANLRPILERHPEVHNRLFEAIGNLEEADALLEDLPNDLDPPGGFNIDLGRM